MSHLSLVTLGVDDLSRATAFYVALGWRRSSASVEGKVAFLRGGASVLALYGRADQAREAGLNAPAPPGVGSITLATNLPNPAAVDALLSAAARHGGTIVVPAADTDWGGYAGCFADPDGHRWEVAHNPHFPLGDDGRLRLPDE